MKRMIITVALFATLTVNADPPPGEKLESWSMRRVYERFDGYNLTNLHFTSAHITNVVSELNRQLARPATNRLPVTISLDMTATQFVIDPDVPSVRTASLPLIQKWKTDYLRAPATQDDVPRITFRARKIELRDFLLYIIANSSPQKCGLGLYPFATSNALVLRPGPPVVECRAYRLDKTGLVALFDKAGIVARFDPAGAYEPALVTSMFAERPEETNLMAWVDTEGILIKIGMPDYLEYFDMIIEYSKTGRRMNGETQPESGHVRK